MKWWWRLRQICVQLGWPWWLALCVLLGTTALYQEVVQRNQEQLTAISTRLEQLRRAETTPALDTRTQTPAEQLEAFFAFFPEDNTQSDALDELFAAAAKENLSLPQGEYQWTREPSARLIRYGITLPLKGPYPGIRRFIAQALQEHPTLSLDAVSFGRQTAGDIGVDAQIRFTLFLREGGS